MRGSIGGSKLEKYIPTPEGARIILAYFIYNNFQDFNTWQQIAHTRAEYTFQEEASNMHKCKISLKWQNRGHRTLVQESQAKSKRKAKKEALKKLLEDLIYQGFIGLGFKNANFLEDLPRRRKDFSDSDSSQDNQEVDRIRKELRAKLNQNGLSLNSFQKDLTVDYWNFALKGDGQECQLVLQQLGLQGGNPVPLSSFERQTQVPYRSQSKDLVAEDLADFIRYYPSQKMPFEPTAIKQRPIASQMLPSQVILSSFSHQPSPRQFLAHFHPIEGRKIFSSCPKPQKECFPLPNFEGDCSLPYKLIDSLYDSLLFQSHRLPFCVHILQMLQKSIQQVSLQSDIISIHPGLKQQGGSYYLRHRNLLTAQFIELLNRKIGEPSANMEGMLLNDNAQQSLFVFEPKQPQEIVAYKLNKQLHHVDFEEIPAISVGEYVLLTSKISPLLMVGLIIEINHQIKVYIPALISDLPEAQPFNLKKLSNKRLYEKTATALLHVSRDCMHLFQDHTTLIWQPPTYSQITVLVELLTEWISSKVTVLIVSMNPALLKKELAVFGIKVLLVTQAMEEKLIAKSTIICSAPNAVCSDILRNYEFTRVCIQEAHLISEILSLLAIAKGCQQLYLIGDPYMPYVHVISPYCELRQMQKSLFGRLFDDGKKALTFHSRQDSHPGDSMILEWSQHYLYSGGLLFLPPTHRTPIIKGFPWPSQVYRVCLLHHDSFLLDREAYLNEQAHICCSIYSGVIRSGFTHMGQIICTTHRPPLKFLLQQHIQRMALDLQINVQQAKKSVRLADGSRHYEREMSILMLGNDASEVGFRVINASFSQASRGVVLVGDMHRLGANPEFAKLIAWGKTNNLVLQISL